jgi:hypothetical protein
MSTTSPLSSRLITSNFSNILSFGRLYAWITLGDVDLPFSLTLVGKANAVEEETG